jgi:hypothetical protein
MRNLTPTGILSEDCVLYGPVEYMSKFAQKGTYDIYVKLFTKSSPISTVVCLVEITKNFGRSNETRTKKAVILKTEKELVLVEKVNY